MQPPKAKIIPQTTVLHGDTREDHYAWLREKSDPEVIAYLEAENAYTGEALAHTADLQSTLYKEMLARIKETDLSVPYRKDGYFYYARTEQGKQYGIYCRKQGSLDNEEQIVLDVNELAKGESYMALGVYTVSDDGRWLAYSTDNTGFREYTLSFKNLESGELLPQRREKTGSVVWANGHLTLFYTVEDAAKRQYRLYRHRLGVAIDDLLYEESDERFRIHVERSRSRAYLFLTSASHTATEVRYLEADQPEREWRLVAAREPEHEYEVDHHGGDFYIRSNQTGRNFALLSAPVDDPRRENWREVVPHRPAVMLSGMDFFLHHRVLMEREDGLPQLTITALETSATHRIAFPEPAYSAAPENNREFDTTVFRYAYQSLVTPPSVFDYDMDRRKPTLLKQTEVLGDFQPARYVSERIYANASDGTRVPISLLYRKDLVRDGSASALLYGYGSYGAIVPVAFNSNRFSLVDRGMVYALAHIRGGGEMGKAWHDQGRMLNKNNSFRDFITAAEHLSTQRFTSPERLSIMGGSAGGLLVGAAANLRPDLFRVVLSHVPFVDVINSMLDESLPLTVGEFEEWGNPKILEHYEYMKTYCPYTNLTAKDYPVMLVKTSLNDSQVMYWEPAKYVAKLRALKTDPNLLLFKINMSAGHGGASGRYDYLHEVAFDYAFLLWQLGLY